MKVMILAGGLGTRLSEETSIKPKPMVEIGPYPILLHIMKLYSFYGFNDFIICCGYRGYVIKEYFQNYFLHGSDVTFDLSNNSAIYHRTNTEPWKITLVDTGLETQTAGRIKVASQYLQDDELFMLTYGDGVGDINLSKLYQKHISSSALVTITTVKPLGRFGSVTIDENDLVLNFGEKTVVDQNQINGGFFVVSKSVLSLITNLQMSWEFDILPQIANSECLQSYQHDGYWQPMDTLREKILLNKMWNENQAPWKVWK